MGRILRVLWTCVEYSSFDSAVSADTHSAEAMKSCRLNDLSRLEGG